jgi:uncharacterized protein YndB with AHSA1/START domain
MSTADVQIGAVKPSLTLKRKFKVAPRIVYAAWTEPRHLMNWFGPAGATMISAETDVRQGGRFHIVFKTPDGEEHDVSGIYDDVVANEKLSFSWMWRTLPDRTSHVTLTFKADGEGTIFTLFHERFFDEPARDRHIHGWSGSLDKLEVYLDADA